MTSKHYTQDRKRREEIIKMIGAGKEIKRTIVDKGHKNGAEIHVLSSTGIVTIYNQRSGKLITKLIARPGQIKRYYNENETVPTELIKLAREHQKMNYNHAQEKGEIKTSPLWKNPVDS